MLNLRKIMQWVIVLAAFVILGCGMAGAQHNQDDGAASTANTGHHHGM